jgi:hypothetical protein
MECGRQPEHRRGLDSQFVVAAPQVLDEGVPSDDDACRPVGLQPAHRPQSGLQPSVVAFASVVLLLAGVVERCRDQLVDHVRQGRCPVGDDLRG